MHLHLHLYSLQRRRERYIIIYVWKILEGKAPNVGLVVNPHPRRDRLCYVQETQGTTARLQTLVHNTFTHNGTRLFNCVPKELHNLTNITVECFRGRLDKWLSDEPPTPGYPNPHHNTLTTPNRGIEG